MFAPVSPPITPSFSLCVSLSRCVSVLVSSVSHLLDTAHVGEVLVEGHTACNRPTHTHRYRESARVHACV